MTATIDHRPPGATATEPAPALEVPRPREPRRITDYWTAGLKFYATGRTAEALRVMAANPEMVHGLAVLSVITDDEEREQMLGIAAAIDALKAEGLTQEQAYFLAGLDRILGVPFSEFTPALLSAA